jgi:hypothetical protein
MQSFREFVDNKQRQAIKHMHLLGKLLETSGFNVKDYAKSHFAEAYLYVYNPFKNTSFDGVRIYNIGDKLAYRVQREHDTHPYGTAYALDIDLIYEDYVDEGEKEIAQKVLETVANELRAFFKESSRAEKALEKGDMDRDGALGMVYIRNPLGGDYSNMVMDRTR